MMDDKNLLIHKGPGLLALFVLFEVALHLGLVYIMAKWIGFLTPIKGVIVKNCPI